MTDEIKDVTQISREGADWICKCPHCHRIATLCDIGEPVRGEQFQHKVCGGWFEVSSNVKIVREL